MCIRACNRTIGLLLGLLFCCLHPGNAQEFLSVNWDELRIDSVLPYSAHVVSLPDDFAEYEYEARIEYPEFEKMPAADILRLKEMNVELADWPQLRHYVGVSAGEGKLYAEILPVVQRKGVFLRLASFKLAISRQKTEKMPTRASSAARYALSSVLSEGKWVKIRIPTTGIYRLTDGELRAMGFTNPAQVCLYGQGGFEMPERGLQDCVDDLQEIPLYRGNGYALFYARGVVKWSRTSGEPNSFEHSRNTYSKYAYYFLTEKTSGSPMSFPVQEGISGGVETTTFPDYALYEKDEFSWMNFGRRFYENYDYMNDRSCSYTFSLPGVLPEKESSLKLSFSSNDEGSNSVSVSVNGSLCGTLPIAGISGYTKYQFDEKIFNCNSLTENTKVSLTHTGKASAHLDYISISYTRQLGQYGAYTCFRSHVAGKREFVVNSANPNTAIWKITPLSGGSAYSCVWLKGAYADGSYRVGDNATLNDEYVAIDLTSSSSFPSVEVVGEVSNQNLHGLTAQDMLIVVPTSAKWLSQAERLAELHRNHDGLRVTVVRADQIYNEFSSGAPDATAIRRFMKMFYDRATSKADMPKYLLLFADCAADNRMVTSAWRNSNPDDFLLCFQSDNSSSATTSYIMEEYFCLLDDNEGTSWTEAKADAAVGRLPVHTLEQATAVVDKIVAYRENREVGAWKNTICLMGDDGDNNDHMSDADQVATLIQRDHPDYILEKVYWDAFKGENVSTGFRYPVVTELIREISERGALMMNYSGHGNANELSHELVWDVQEMEALDSPRLPLWVTAACDTSPIDLPGNNLGEAVVLNDCGAIAMLGTTRSTYRDRSLPMNKAFTKYVLQGEPMGEALRLAKNEIAASINNLHFILIGDPALRLATPDSYKIEITEVNGQPVGLEPVQFKAGSRVTVGGKVVGTDGSTVEGFKGIVHHSVYDGETLVVCNGNDSGVEEQFEYWDYSSKVFMGSDSVRGGKFSLTFPVPLDISYSQESGKIYFYAYDTNRTEAQGGYDKFFMDGTADGLSNDSLGPEIDLRLNTSDFLPGDRVNETPLLILSLHDVDGINASGSGIGHDLVAIIDNDVNQTYVLNNYYVPEPGDYTRGTVVYSLPEIPAGMHTIMVRAWDVLNNSTTVEVPFEVVKGLAPTIFNVWCTASPARTSTTFVITHNRPQTALEARVEILDFSGRLLWEHTEAGTPAENQFRITWNLTTDGGRPLGNGIYLYRVTLSAKEGGRVSKTQKIVIARQ